MKIEFELNGKIIDTRESVGIHLPRIGEFVTLDYYTSYKIEDIEHNFKLEYQTITIMLVED